MMGHREKLEAIEADAVSRRWRRYLKWGRGERAEIKRTMRRRERRKARRDLEKDVG